MIGKKHAHGRVRFLLCYLLWVTIACQPYTSGTQHEGKSLNEISDKAPTDIDVDDKRPAVLANPALAADFLRLEDGTDLKTWTVKNTQLRLAYGAGKEFGPVEYKKYQALKEATQQRKDHNVQWALMNLSDHVYVDASADAHRKIFGASASKPFVGATLLVETAQQLNSLQRQLFADMLVVSSNSAWVNLQRQIGDGDADKGRERIHDFTQRMGYQRTRGFQGYWGDLHGNELTAMELVDFFYDSYKNNFEGGSTLWKLMHTCRTGTQRGRLYLPKDLPVGGKTGTYDGPTVDPETGSSTFPDGRPYQVQVRNHALTFWVHGKQYALAVLANDGQNMSAALLAGGLYQELLAAGQ